MKSPELLFAGSSQDHLPTWFEVSTCLLLQAFASVPFIEGEYQRVSVKNILSAICRAGFRTSCCRTSIVFYGATAHGF